MSGSLDNIQSSYFLQKRKRQSEQRMPVARRVRAAPADAVLSALLITIGLCAGVVAVLPIQMLEHLPLVHLAVAFFIPLTALFSFSELNLAAIGKAITQGLLAVLMVGVVAVIVATCVHSSATAPAERSVAGSHPGQYSLERRPSGRLNHAIVDLPQGRPTRSRTTLAAFATLRK